MLNPSAKTNNRNGVLEYPGGGISQLDERTDMTSLNKDSTFDREDLSEMMQPSKSQADHTFNGRP